jgi:phosphoadenosine phosphosulfate reductase
MAPEQRTERVDAVWQLLQAIARDHPPAVLACSFGAEDMVLVDLIARAALPIGLFTLDTGRLPAETYDLVARVRLHYGATIDVLYPDTRALEAYTTRNGFNAFYRSVSLREECCAIRKAEPLARALQGKGAWITGLRRGQGTTRTGIAIREAKAPHGLPKFNPLADWSEDDVWSYVRTHAVPYNALHDRGYRSIGCAPCTRAVQPGEDVRAGRWWWEAPDRRECGLHRRPLDIAVRQVHAGVST